MSHKCAFKPSGYLLKLTLSYCRFWVVGLFRKQNQIATTLAILLGVLACLCVCVCVCVVCVCVCVLCVSVCVCVTISQHLQTSSTRHGLDRCFQSLDSSMVSSGKKKPRLIGLIGKLPCDTVIEFNHLIKIYENIER